MVQQSRKPTRRRAATRTIAEWIVLFLNLGLGIGTWFLHPRLPFPFVWHEMVMFQWGLFLVFVGYLGAGITLLLYVRRVTALFQFLCALAWWFMIAHQLIVSRFPDGSYQPATGIACAGLFLTGLIHALIARWLWHLDSTKE
jgi:hypothetical protein